MPIIPRGMEHETGKRPPLTQTTTLFENIRPRYPEFQGQVALITGSSRGIGKGIALRLGREGMKLVLHGLDGGKLTRRPQNFRRWACQP